jgi:aryl-alcohol dehydrogenase-like predicted oxidoreductase
METRRIGTLDVSVVGLGTNNFGWMDHDDVVPVVDAALEVGINFFDTADAYGDSEVRLADALGSHRDRVLIATKFGSPLPGAEGTGGARPGYVRAAVDRSLTRLRTGHIDLYQLHRPDRSTPVAETLATLDDLVKAGKIREIGCSNFTADQLREAAEVVSPGSASFVSVQNHYNLLNRGDETSVLPECSRTGRA